MLLVVHMLWKVESQDCMVCCYSHLKIAQALYCVNILVVRVFLIEHNGVVLGQI